MGAFLRPHNCMRPLKLPDLALWAIGRLTTEQKGETLFPGHLAAAGAEQVDPAEWLMMNEKGDLFSPLVGLDFAAYLTPTRLARERCNLGGPRGVRLGPRVRGSLTHRLRAPKKMPPGTSKASPRAVIQFLGNPLQMGYPASANTDACLGFPVMAHW